MTSFTRLPSHLRMLKPLSAFIHVQPDCCWSEVSGGSLLITGGGPPAVKEVVRIDTRREFDSLEP
jgi:hypothetical protein